MYAGTISLRYARALMIHAAKHGVVGEVYADAQALAAAWTKYPALRRVLDNRLLDNARKVAALSEACGGLSPRFNGFTTLVIGARRGELLQTICLDYMQLVREQEGLLDVWVTTAAGVDEATRALFAEKLGLKTGRKVTLHTAVDKSLIGGYVLRWDTYRLDRSVAGALKRIEKQLSNG